MRRRCGWGLIAVIACLAFSSFGVAPAVTRVEPPNWWVGHSHNPVRLLISGTHFSEDCRVVVPPTFRIQSVRASTNGLFLFADLLIPERQAPGEVTLQVIDGGATNLISYPLLPRLDLEAGHLRGDVRDARDHVALILVDQLLTGPSCGYKGGLMM